MLQLRDDQIEDLAVLLNNPKHIHGGEPGTGKTPTVCVLQAIRWKKEQVGTVWVMPLKLTAKNLDEAMRWGGWQPDEVVIVDGTPAQVARKLRSRARVFIMGFTRFARCWKQLPAYVTAVDVDEFHKGFGGTESRRTGALYEFMEERGTHFVPMTGTLYKGRPDTVYPALQIIEPRYYGTPDLFRNIHHVLDPFTGKTIGYRNLEALGDVLQKHSIKRLWTDIHGAEDKVIHIERVDMSDRQRVVYDKFRNDAVLELERFFIDGTQPGVAFIRARQIMEHPNCFPDLRDPDHLPPVDICPGEVASKLELIELDLTNAAENKTPLIVFTSLRPQQREIFQAAKKLGMKVGILNGDTTPSETKDLDEGFRSGKYLSLICSAQVADCGYNWQFCGDQEVNDIVFASMDYNDTTFFQAYKRCMREARKAALRIKIPVYRDSIDEHILRLIQRKSKEAHEVDQDREILDII